jgi:predicted nucleic acid-binding protein
LIVLDASALLELLTRSDRGLRVETRVMRTSETLHAPALIDVEVTQVLRRYVASGQVPEHWAQMALQVVTAFPMTRYLHEPLMRRAWELKDNVTAYDGVYIALAEALRSPLVTCDSRLSKAPGIHTTVELIA